MIGKIFVPMYDVYLLGAVNSAAVLKSIVVKPNDGRSVIIYYIIYL